MSYRRKEQSLVHLPLMEWASYHPICKNHLIHIANERKCSPFQGNLLRKLGVKSGVSDLFLAYPNTTYAGLWIELKYPPNTLTASQKEWQNLMNSVGYRAVWHKDWTEARQEILTYLEG